MEDPVADPNIHSTPGSSSKLDIDIPALLPGIGLGQPISILKGCYNVRLLGPTLATSDVAGMARSSGTCISTKCLNAAGPGLHYLSH